ncbi:MAG: hypothetical protein HY744_24815 [Deltaproteobacteria bacterium]|nr:hypothetical protein [Deltaproteobacteria bacterium]
MFVHRDANTAGTAARRQEIEKAAAPTGLPVVPVIPVRALEAWLLLDEQSIREVAGNPRGTVPLGLPEPRRVERVVKPKALLREVIATASEASGRRLARLHRSFPQARAQRLSRLSLDGPVAGVPGWQVLVHDTREAIEALRRGMVRPQEP